MTIGTFILKNALRNKRRALLSILSVAASLFLLVTLLVTLRELTIPPEDIGAASRVAVRNRISIASPLPARQRPIIERIPGVAAVTPFTWYAGRYRNEQAMTFAQFALDPQVLTNIFGEAKLPLDQLVAFQKDRQACVVGKITADKYLIKVGDRMVLPSTIYPCTIELRVAGIYEGSIDDRNVFFHHKYFDEASGMDGWVGMWWLRVRTLDEVPEVVERINRAFANTAAEVRAETERTFQMSFVAMWGNIKILIHAICSVVIFTLLLVSVSTVSMAIRERMRELAILKALGFRQRDLGMLILAESFGLAVVGAILGIGGAWALYRWVSIAKLTNGIFITFEVTPRMVGLATLVAAVLGVLATIAPIVTVARTSVVEGLRTLD